MDPGSPLIPLIGNLIIEHGIHVAVVTAAGYFGPSAPQLYMKRLGPLLAHVESRSRALQDPGGGSSARVFIFGGESSDLFAFGPVEGDTEAPWTLQEVAPETYLSPDAAIWSLDTDLISRMLDVAQASLENTARLLGLSEKLKIVRKPRAVGVVATAPGFRFGREQLDEFALASQHAVNRWQGAMKASAFVAGEDFVSIPFCAFNGGSDCFVDVGNRLIGVSLLLGWLGLEGGECLHVDDQFLGTGDDVATRSACSTIWVAGVSETTDCLRELSDAVEAGVVRADLMSPREARLKLDRLPSVQVADT